MLTSKEKKVLKGVIKYAKKHHTNFINTNNHEKYDEFVSKAGLKKYSKKDLASIFDSLYDKNFFEKEPYAKYSDWGRAFTLTHDTQQYNELRIKKTVVFIVNSLAIPAIVAVITTLITNGSK